MIDLNQAARGYRISEITNDQYQILMAVNKKRTGEEAPRSVDKLDVDLAKDLELPCDLRKIVYLGHKDDDFDEKSLIKIVQPRLYPRQPGVDMSFGTMSKRATLRYLLKELGYVFFIIHKAPVRVKVKSIGNDQTLY